MTRIAALILAFPLGVIATPLRAADDARLLECASLPDDAARLACFDAYAAAVVGGQSIASPAQQARPDEDGPNSMQPMQGDPEPVAAEAAPVREREGNESERTTAAPDEPEAYHQVARIEEFIRLNRSNRIRVTLDNGQIWQENDGAPFRGNLEPGMEVTITKGRFGGYRMNVPTRSAAIFVRRLR